MITGISNEMVEDAPRFSEVAESFAAFARDAIFVAHNVRFDYGFLQKEFQRLNMSFTRPCMCTIQGMRKNFPGLQSYSLKNLTQHFQIPLNNHHRALCDAKAAAELLFLINGKRVPNSVHYELDDFCSDFPAEINSQENHSDSL
jgi:DNA polymerase-3 subunit epsilon